MTNEQEHRSSRSAENGVFCLAAWGKFMQFYITDCPGRSVAPDSEQSRPFRREDKKLVCNSFRLTRTKQSFEMSNSSEIIVAQEREETPFDDGKNSVYIVDCKIITIQACGLCRPFVLTASNTQTKTIFQTFVYLPESNSFEKFGSFCLIHDILWSISDSYIELLDGPAVLRHCKRSLHIALWDANRGAFQVKKHPLECPTPNYRVKFVSGEAGRFSVLLAATSQRPDNSESDLFEEDRSHDCDWLLLGVTLDSVERTSRGRYKIPYEYAAVTDKMTMTRSSQFSALQDGFLLGTSLAQLVYIKSTGDSRCQRDRHVCLLPFDDVSSIAVTVIGGNELVLVGSKTKGTCAVATETFRMIRYWSDAHAVTSDDFLGVGNDQLLLVCQSLSSVKSKIQKFILTDLSQTWPSTEVDSGAEKRKAGATCPGYIQSAIHALESRLQSCETLLHDLQLHSCEKDSIIRQNVAALKTISSDTGIVPQNKSNLIPIIQSDADNVTDRGIESADESIQGTIKTESFWQRIWGRVWIVGILVTNLGPGSISDISLSLVGLDKISNLSANDLTFQSGMFFPSGETGFINQDRRVNIEDREFLGPGEQCWITAKSKLPILDASHCQTYDVLLLWRERRTDEGQSGRSVQKRECVASCKLSVDDIDQWMLDFTLEKIQTGQITQVDYLAIDCLQLCHRLDVSSKQTNLEKIPTMLRTDLGFVNATMVSEGLFCEKGFLSGTRIFLELVDSTTIVMRLHTWDKTQLALFCRAFYSILPSDATLSTADPDVDAKTRSRSDVIKCVHMELQKIKASLNSPQPSQNVSSENGDVSTTEHFLKLKSQTDKAMRKLIGFSNT